MSPTTVIFQSKPNTYLHGHVRLRSCRILGDADRETERPDHPEVLDVAEPETRRWPRLSEDTVRTTGSLLLPPILPAPVLSVILPPPRMIWSRNIGTTLSLSGPLSEVTRIRLSAVTSTPSDPSTILATASCLRRSTKIGLLGPVCGGNIQLGGFLFGSTQERDANARKIDLPLKRRCVLRLDGVVDLIARPGRPGDVECRFNACGLW
jgi:hypothetical protein